jgi:small subunit ribosomal protein S9
MIKKKAASEAKAASKKQATLAHAVGRRKTSVARVFVRRGTGKIVVNNQDYMGYFDTEVERLKAGKPFQVIPVAMNFDVEASVEGGGKKGQADAVKLGVARALLSLDEGLRPSLREHELLTVDSRQKERKKYGQKGARRKFQFVKR